MLHQLQAYPSMVPPQIPLRYCPSAQFAFLHQLQAYPLVVPPHEPLRYCPGAQLMLVQSLQLNPSAYRPLPQDVDVAVVLSGSTAPVVQHLMFAAPGQRPVGVGPVQSLANTSMHIPAGWTLGGPRPGYCWAHFAGLQLYPSVVPPHTPPR